MPKETPLRNGKRWSNDEDTQLLKGLADGLKLKDIAAIHQRTVSSLLTRRKIIASKLFLSGVPVSEISKQVKLSEQQVNFAISHVNI